MPGIVWAQLFERSSWHYQGLVCLYPEPGRPDWSALHNQSGRRDLRKGRRAIHIVVLSAPLDNSDLATRSGSKLDLWKKFQLPN
jgi:hypothetical protein